MDSILLTQRLLVGQHAEVGADSAPFEPMLLNMIVVLAILVVTVGLPVFLGLRAEQRKQEMKHAERMRAIELGHPMRGDVGWWSPARLAIGMGVGVPVGVFGIAWVAAASVESAAPFIWPSAGAVGVTAVICGTVLAARIPPPRSDAPDPRAKPYVDPDAYDAAEHQHA